MRIERYTPDFRERWDDFAARSRCGTFLFQRAYMDYHADRFTDCSLLAFTPRGRLVAMLPAEICGKVISSHRGLTYGGWITPMRHFDAVTMIRVFEAAIPFMHSLGAEELVYKPLPHIYPYVPADEDLFALFRLGARQTECVLSSAIDLHHRVPLNESTRQALKLAASSGLTVGESADLEEYWRLLTECLRSRHGVSPVHTSEEMCGLVDSFPRNIRLFTAVHAGEIHAGALLYFCDRTIHIQYMATSPYGRQVKALSAVIEYIINNCSAGYDYLDFGGSTENGGLILNEGLLLQKSGLGGRAVACPVYRLHL